MSSHGNVKVQTFATGVVNAADQNAKHRLENDTRHSCLCTGSDPDLHVYLLSVALMAYAVYALPSQACYPHPRASLHACLSRNHLHS